MQRLNPVLVTYIGVGLVVAGSILTGYSTLLTSLSRVLALIGGMIMVYIGVFMILWGKKKYSEEAIRLMEMFAKSKQSLIPVLEQVSPEYAAVVKEAYEIELLFLTGVVSADKAKSMYQVLLERLGGGNVKQS